MTKLKSEISIAGRRVAADAPLYVIGEMACGHQGSVEMAKALVDSAVSAGADCVQLQIFDTAANMAPTAPIYSLLQQLYIDRNGWREIMDHARKSDIHVSIFVYDEPSFELALDLGPDMLKLNSSELSNPAMIIAAARSGLPFTMGTGASSLREIHRAVDIALANDGEQLILMCGVQNFPTTVEEANIRKIRRLKDEFGGLIIYADHTSAEDEMSLWIDMAAIGQGAELVEKHLILDRSKMGVDWQAALEPNEFKAYVAAMKRAWAAMGPVDFQPFTPNELKYRRFQKKSLVAGRDLQAGDVLALRDVKFLRVQGEQEGIAPIDFDAKAAGRRLKRAVECFAQIHEADLD